MRKSQVLEFKEGACVEFKERACVVDFNNAATDDGGGDIVLVEAKVVANCPNVREGKVFSNIPTLIFSF